MRKNFTKENFFTPLNRLCQVSYKHILLPIKQIFNILSKPDNIFKLLRKKLITFQKTELCRTRFTGLRIDLHTTTANRQLNFVY